jgi:hypothetical protein
MTILQEHFSAEQWTDFTRQVAPSALAEAMQSHLNHSCESCTRDLSFWQGFAETAAADAAYEPPRQVLAEAKAQFAKWMGIPERPSFAKLVFDTWLQPAMAGIRSGAAATRQMIFEAGDLTIDIRVHSANQPGLNMVAGQIVRAQEPNDGIADALLSARSGGQVVARAKSNEFGEFALSAVPDPVTLAIRLEGGRTILIGLPEGRGRSLRGEDVW